MELNDALASAIITKHMYFSMFSAEYNLVRLYFRHCRQRQKIEKHFCYLASHPRLGKLVKELNELYIMFIKGRGGRHGRTGTNRGTA